MPKHSLQWMHSRRAGQAQPAPRPNFDRSHSGAPGKLRLPHVGLISVLLTWLICTLALASGAAAQDAQPTIVPTVPLQQPSAQETPSFLPSLSGVGGTARDVPVAIRSGPGVTFRIIGVLRPGRSIDITGTNGFDAERSCSPNFEADLDMWVEVRFRETVGWMARCTLDIRGDLSKLPTEATPPPVTPTPFSYSGAAG